MEATRNMKSELTNAIQTHRRTYLIKLMFDLRKSLATPMQRADWWL